MASQPDMNVVVNLNGPGAAEAVVIVAVSAKAHDLLQRLVATGLFGFDVPDCAQRMLYEQLRAREREGWAKVPSPTKPPAADFVAEMTAERTKKNPRFPALVAAAKKRRAR